MEIIHKYDSITQKLINELQEHIAFIGKQYESKLHPETAKEYFKLSMPGYEEALIEEYKEAIKPFQKKLEEIYLTTVPKIIIITGKPYKI